MTQGCITIWAGARFRYHLGEAPSLHPVTAACRMMRSRVVPRTRPVTFISENRDLSTLRKAIVGLDLATKDGGLVAALPGLRAWGVETVILTHVSRESPVPLLHQVDQTEGVSGKLAQANAWLSPFFGVELCLRSGSAGACLAEEAGDRGANLIVLGVGARGRLQEAIVGSTVLEVVRRSDLPVLLFPHAALRGRRGRPLVSPHDTWILHPTDFSHASQRALDLARELALEKNLPITVLHVLDARDPTPEEEVRDRLGRLADELTSAGVTGVETVLERGTAWERVLAVSAESDHTLVVMGTRGRGLLPGAILGSQSREVARRIAFPLLLVPYRVR